MPNKRKPLSRFINNAWTNMNIRAGKYRHLRTESKSYTYNITIDFTRDEFVQWCKNQETHILSLARPSIDRLDKNLNYSLPNMQVIELAENIRKDKTVFFNGYGVCYKCKETKIEELFTVDKRRFNGRSSICLTCESARKSDYYRRNTGK